MRKTLGLFVLLAAYLLFPTALADTLPPDVGQAFSDPKWSGYQIAAVSGYDGSAKDGAAYAVLLKKGEYNVLCILEKDIGESAYRLTMETDKAVYQGALLPSIHMDAGGDKLFYDYTTSGGGKTGESISVYKSGDGQWGPVQFLSYQEKDDRYLNISVTPNRGTLEYRSVLTDTPSNNSTGDFMQFLPALPEEMYMLANFSISDLPKTYEAALLKYHGLPYANTLLFCAEQVITRGAILLTFEVWGFKNGETGQDRFDLVRVKSSGEVRQEIPIGLESWPFAEGAILFEDANFDGFMDFLICRSSGAYNLYYDYWLWDTANCRFMEADDFNRLDAYPTFDSTTKQIHCSSKDGAAQYYEYDYQVGGDGLPHLIAKRDIHYDSPEKRTIILWQPVDGKMTIIKKWTE